MERLSRDDYYMEVARTVAKRGTCNRGRAGAVIVKYGRIVSTGYVGAPAGLPHCDEVGHDILKINGKEHCIRTVHAELNAILQAAKFGIGVEDGEMYCTMFPCYDCAKAILNVGIWKVIADYSYQSMDRSEELFKEVGLFYKIYHGGVKEY